MKTGALLSFRPAVEGFPGPLMLATDFLATFDVLDALGTRERSVWCRPRGCHKKVDGIIIAKSLTGALNYFRHDHTPGASCAPPVQ